MALNERTRRKHAQSAAKVLPAGSQIVDYVNGRGHARMTTGVMVAGGVFAVVFLVLLAMGYIVFPGFILIAFIVSSVRPPLGVAATDRGLAVLGRSPWTGSPNRVIELLPPAPVYAASPTGNPTVQLGSERITFPRKEFDRLSAATNQSYPGAGYPGAGGYPGVQPGGYPGAQGPAPAPAPQAPDPSPRPFAPGPGYMGATQRPATSSGFGGLPGIAPGGEPGRPDGEPRRPTGNAGFGGLNGPGADR